MTDIPVAKVTRGADRKHYQREGGKRERDRERETDRERERQTENERQMLVMNGPDVDSMTEAVSQPSTAAFIELF